MPFAPRLFLSCLALAPAFVLAEPVPSESAPWDAALNFDFNAASALFAERHAGAPDDARLALAHAGALLARQPRTNANVIGARATVARVLAAPEGTVAPAHHALALYLEARIAHDHLAEPDLPAARAGYALLRQTHPDNPLADHAAAHLAIILLQQTPGLDFEARRDGLADLVAAVRAPSAKRELLFLLGRLHWEERGDAASALEPLLAARALGFESPARDGEVDLFIAELAARAGRPALSARHYLAFADAYPRDTRSHTARRLAAEQTSATPAVATR